MRQILALNQEQRSLARKGKECLKCISEIFRRKVKIKIQNLYFCNSSIYSVKSEKGDYFFVFIKNSESMRLRIFPEFGSMACFIFRNKAKRIVFR